MKNMADIENYALMHSIPIMQDEGVQLVIRLCKENHCHSFLEIGTAIGRTALLIASLDPSMQVVTIERDPEMIVQAKANFNDSLCGNQITLIEGDALTIDLPAGPFDCIFIDGAKAQYTRFFNKYVPLLSKNGIIISDNMKFHGLVDHPERTHNRNTKALVRKLRGYREFLDALVDYETEFYEDGDGVAVTRKRRKLL